MDVAVSLSVGCLGTVPEKLQVLANECSHVKGVRKQLSFLENELGAMHAFLLKVAAMEKEGPVDIQLKAWAREVRETSYDVEDCVDDFTRSLHHSAGGKQQGMVKNFFTKCANFLGTLHTWHKFADEIDALKARVVEASERRERYKLDDLVCCHSRNLTIDPRLSALFTEGDRLVGIDGPRDELMRWLVGADGGMAVHLRVLSIIGFGGLGKTTLARQVYLKIGDDFPYKIFLSVSQKPNLRKILQDCLCWLPHGDIETWDEAKMITEIREYLADKRYLVVIDDVWSIPACNFIRNTFPDNTCSSRIILTTRLSDVAHSCSSVDGRVYKMEPLSLYHSKKLFFKRIFGSEECQEQFEDISDEILKKCGGLPLAITNISGLLANKPAVKEEWEKVRSSIGSALEKDSNLEGLNSILMLSYSDLPHSLQTCFLYLSVFPEDCNIEKDRLIRRWIAENFIAGERGRTLEEIGETYFYELINRSLVQPTEFGPDGKPCGCVVHDIMLELMITKAAEENFVTVCQGFVPKPQGSIRRLSIQQGEQEAMSGLQENVSHVRTLAAYGPVKNIPRLEDFQRLQVLDLERCIDLELYDFSKIDGLTQLRYLSLRNAVFLSQLPSGVVKLFDLELLDIRGTQITEVPVGIIHLKKLKHFLTGKVDQGLTVIPEGICSMKSLQTVLGFNVMKSSIASVLDLGNLANLKELSLQFNTEGHDQIRRHEEALLSSLCKLGSHLRSFWIRSIDSSWLEFLNSWTPEPVFLQRFKMSTNYYFLKIPKWVGPELSYLQYISINIAEVTEADICVFSELCSLTFLDLWFKEDPKERIIFRAGGFNSLKVFHYVRRPYIVRGAGYLVFETGALPKLERLSVPFSVSMAKGHDFYLGIVHLESLKLAEVILGKESATIQKEAIANPSHPKVTIIGEEQ